MSGSNKKKSIVILSVTAVLCFCIVLTAALWKNSDKKNDVPAEISVSGTYNISETVTEKNDYFSEVTAEQFEIPEISKIPEAPRERIPDTEDGRYTVMIGKTYNNTTGIQSDNPVRSSTKHITLNSFYGAYFLVDSNYKLRLYVWQDDDTFDHSEEIEAGQIIPEEYRTIAVRFERLDGEEMTFEDEVTISESFKIMYATESQAEEYRKIAEASQPVLFDVSDEFDRRYVVVKMRWTDVPQTTYLFERSADVFSWFDELAEYNSSVTRREVGVYTDKDGTERSMYEYVVSTAGSSSERPQIYITCIVHGREKITAYTAYQAAKQMTDSSSPFSHISEIADVHIIPVVNQYGFDLWSNSEDQSAWDNSRTNSFGINLNRQFKTDLFSEEEWNISAGSGNYPEFEYYIGGNDSNGRPNPVSADEIPETVLLKQYFFDSFNSGNNNNIFIDLHMTVQCPAFLTSEFESDRNRWKSIAEKLAPSWMKLYRLYLNRQVDDSRQIVRKPETGSTTNYIGTTYADKVRSAVTLEVMGGKAVDSSPYSLDSELVNQDLTELYHWLDQTLKDLNYN